MNNYTLLTHCLHEETMLIDPELMTEYCTRCHKRVDPFASDIRIALIENGVEIL